MTDSYQRRYKQTKAALMGMTSSFQQQLDKIKAPVSSAPLPFVQGYEDLLKRCTLSDETTGDGHTTSISSDDTMLLNGGRTHLDKNNVNSGLMRYQDLEELDLELV